MTSLPQVSPIPLCGETWALKSEVYASLVAKHLTPDSVWLDAGCGSRLLEPNMDPLENWLVGHCKTLVGMDLGVTANRNIKNLVHGSLYQLPFPDNSLDLVTCRMVVEHLDEPKKAFGEVTRCLRPGGAVVVITPNLQNYAVFGNAVARKVLPQKLRLRIVHSFDDRADEDIFPTCYKANTMRRLTGILERAAGLQLHETIGLRQQRPYWPKHALFEKPLMWMTPIYVLLVCAHKPEKK